MYLRELFSSDESELEFAALKAGTRFPFPEAVLPALTLKDSFQTLALCSAVALLERSELKCLIRHSVFCQTQYCSFVRGKTGKH